MDTWVLLSDVVLLLAAALLLGGIFSHMGQSPLVGYLLAGMLLGGPGSIHAVKSGKEIESIAELGVALLLFSLGLEFSIARLKSLGARTLFAGVLQVVLTMLLATAVSLAFGLGAAESVAVGAMISLSSTAVVLRVLMERSELETVYGRNSLAVLLVQDMAVVPLALLMTLLAGGGQPGELAWSVGKLFVLATGLVFGLYILLNKIAVYSLGTLTLVRNRELTVILAVVTGLGATWASHEAGISPALGAFMAGMFLGSSVFATQIRADIASLRVVLLTLFFGAAGMVADPVWIIQNWYLVLGATAVLIVGKAAVVWGIFLLFGQGVSIAAASGICLAQIGEFAFVLGSIGHSGGVVSEDTYVLVVSVTIVSLFLSALLIPAAPRLGKRFASLLRVVSPQIHAGGSTEAPPDVVIIGFGPVGWFAAHTMIGRPERVLVIDLNRDSLRKARELGFHGHIGDATQSEVLEHAKINMAKAVIITVPHHRSAMDILQQVRQLAPHAHTMVRSRYHKHGPELETAGAHTVVGDEEESGKRLGEQLQHWLDEHAPPEPTPAVPNQ